MRKKVFVDSRDNEDDGAYPFTQITGVFIKEKYKNVEDFNLANVWRAMMRRCFSPSKEQYKNYGAKGITVCRKWHNQNVFIEDAKKLYGYADKAQHPLAYELDKDYYGSTQYSNSTCIWLSQTENTLYQGHPLKVTINGEIEYFISECEFRRKYTMIGPKMLYDYFKSGKRLFIPQHGRSSLAPVMQIEKLTLEMTEGKLLRLELL